MIEPGCWWFEEHQLPAAWGDCWQVEMWSLMEDLKDKEWLEDSEQPPRLGAVLSKTFSLLQDSHPLLLVPEWQERALVVPVRWWCTATCSGSLGEARHCLHRVGAASGASRSSSLDSGAGATWCFGAALLAGLVHSTLEVGQCARLVPIPSGGRAGWCGWWPCWWGWWRSALGWSRLCSSRSELSSSEVSL